MHLEKQQVSRYTSSYQVFRKEIALLLFLIIPIFAWSSTGYQRIVSLTPSLTQNLYYLEVQNRLVGCTSYCVAAKLDNKIIVASALKPNIEKIVGLKPDLVLASGLTSPKDVAILRKLGIRVEVFFTPKSFDEICLHFERLAKLTGQTTKAASVLAEAKAKVRLFQFKLKKASVKPKVFMQIGSSPIFSVLPNTFMQDYITYCGGVNIGNDLKGGTIGRELVVARNPDYIFIVSMDMMGDDEKAQWNKFSHMEAVKKNQIFILDANMACQPTPITFVQTIETIAKYMKL
ncbi:MAG: hypothetical protein RL662_667 [Bacteroidota bacterium]|jgi:iron complex transport system substrate-binding protein